jgi:hypothetical protein
MFRSGNIARQVRVRLHGAVSPAAPRAFRSGVASVVTNAGIFQSVSLPAGKSVVRFAYAPPYMFVAWACCAAGFALLLFGRPLLAKPRRLDEDEAAKELP